MRAVIQRVQRANVSVESKTVSTIGRGILTLLGVATGDTEDQLQKVISKISELRIFEDDQGKMNLSLKDIQGEHLIVSQFTLLADCSQGRRPGFSAAEKSERARELYEKALALSAALGIKTAGGVFQADMKVELVNDGPATFVVEA